MKVREEISELRDRLLENTVEGKLWSAESNNAIRCFSCGHRCFIPEGFDGICKVRSNVGGKLRVPWGYVGGLNADPIEKKPFFHVLPGSRALSFGMLGCDFRCGYCQNWLTSQALRDVNAQSRPEKFTADELVSLAIQSGSKVVTSTYNEPLITSEWAVEIFKKAKTKGLKTSYVSNGNGTKEVLEYIRPHTDFYKIDLKSFRDRSYRELGGVLNHVTETIANAYQMGFWVEIVTLIIPGFNDDPGELKALCEFLASVSPNIPWHATAFHQDYKMRTPDNTGVAKLFEAGEIAKKAGLNFVYLGNRAGQVGNWENTYCAFCNELLVQRLGFRVLKNRMSSNSCPKCQGVVPGFWSMEVVGGER